MIDYLLLISSIALGALSVFLFRLHEPKRVRLLNAFTGAYLLCLTLMHLLPEIYHIHGDEAGEHPAVRLGILMLVGFFVQVALDVISGGVEHGHTHHHHGHGHGRVPIGIVIGLCIHAFVEAMALGEAGHHFDHGSRGILLWSIVLHNFPVSIALMGMLLQGGLSRGKALWILAIFAMMAPIGMTFSAHTFLGNYTRELTALVVGIFLHIATTILFESSDGHKFNLAKLWAIILGTALGFLTLSVH
jgi:zinc and cadmium transporter